MLQAEPHRYPSAHLLQDVLQANQHQPHHYHPLLQRRSWDMRHFGQVNLPIILGQLTGTAQFSAQQDMRVLDMPIYMPAQGWRIPPNLAQFKELIDLVMAYENMLRPTLADAYVYITIDQKHLTAGQTGRRAGCHSDGFVPHGAGPVCHTYMVTDCMPEEFFACPFPLITADNAHNAMQTFDMIANRHQPLTHAPYTVLKLDPYVVHRAAVAPRDCYRTFVKISVSTKQYNRAGNTHNALFDYNWQMVNRSATQRNHPSIHVKAA